MRHVQMQWRSARVTALATAVAPQAATADTSDPTPHPAPCVDPLRVLSFNIHHGRGADGTIDLERIAAVIRAARPHVVALQEVDRGTRRSGGVDQAAELGRLCGMAARFGPAMDYRSGQYGNAVLSALPMVATQDLALPGGGEPRAAVGVVVQVAPGVRVEVVSTRLDHGAGKNRRDAAVALARWLAAQTPTQRIDHLLIGRTGMTAVDRSGPIAPTYCPSHI